jgi:hypothetical protein
MENDLAAVQAEVERLARDHPFELVEDFINGLAIDDRPKAALWLLAWSYMSPADQRRIAYEALASTAQ